MLLVQIITPDFLEKGESVECDVCSEMKYSAEDYKSLYSANKLIYFYIPEEENIKDDISLEMIMCYGCLFKYIQKTSGGSEETVLILDDEGLIEHTFTPDELDTGNPHYFDFLKDDDDDIDEEDNGYDDNDEGDGFLPPPNFRG
jgi:hypothetical protein